MEEFDGRISIHNNKSSELGWITGLGIETQILDPHFESYFGSLRWISTTPIWTPFKSTLQILRQIQIRPSKCKLWITVLWRNGRVRDQKPNLKESFLQLWEMAWNSKMKEIIDALYAQVTFSLSIPYNL